MWIPRWFSRMFGGWFGSGSSPVSPDIDLSSNITGSSYVSADLELQRVPTAPGLGWFGKWFKRFGSWFYTEHEPPVPPPEPLQDWQVRQPPLSRPSTQFQEVDDRCVTNELLDLPAPTDKAINCRAVLVTPSPPVPVSRLTAIIEIKEEGPIKQFQPGPENLTPPNSADWKLGSISLPVDLPFGEKCYVVTGGPVVVPGMAPQQGESITGSPLFARQLFLEVMIGSYNGPRNLAPKMTMAHLPANSVFMHLPGAWLSLSPLVIESYRPFKASTCATNAINGKGPETQYAGVLNAGFTSVVAWAPACSVWSGSTVKLVFTETGTINL